MTVILSEVVVSNANGNAVEGPLTARIATAAAGTFDRALGSIVRTPSGASGDECGMRSFDSVAAYISVILSEVVVSNANDNAVEGPLTARIATAAAGNSPAPSPLRMTTP